MKVPKGEVQWVAYRDGSGVVRFLLTSKPMRDIYYLYEIHEDDSWVKLGKAKSPPELEARFKVDERIGIKA